MDITKALITCRFCKAPLEQTFVNLGMSPLCESFLLEDQLNEMEPFYPLQVYVCGKCFLVQLQEYVAPENIFSHYAYFSSYSDSWLAHARTYTEKMIERFGLGASHQIVELASNDGYLLQYFVARGIPALGVEPAQNVADVAIRKGLPTLVSFFGMTCAEAMVRSGQMADLVIGNNVLAQVPDVNDFVAGMKIILKPGGVITMEFPHLLRLMQENQFDTIYHEHFSYFSLATAQAIFAAHGLTFFDVEEISSLREREEKAGLLSLGAYTAFAEQVRETKRKLLEFLVAAKRAGKTIVGYGAPGKANTLLNYCGIRTDFLDYTVDRNPFKHGKFTPGTRIPIFPPERIRETRPDYLLILPWNLKDEIMSQCGYIREWKGQFVVPIPEVRSFA
jgi:SAM-dependent methyltransferase